MPTVLAREREAVAVVTSRAESGRSCNFTTLLVVPLPPSMWKGRSGAISRPHRLAFPSGIGIIDAAIHPFWHRSPWIRDAQVDELTVHQGKQRLVGITSGDRQFLPSPNVSN